MTTKHVYFFGGGTADGDGKMKELLGGKGANLAEMCKIGIPVPPGFTITTEAPRRLLRQQQEDPRGGHSADRRVRQEGRGGVRR
jgi:pyruvate,orthophosphate dikinase